MWHRAIGKYETGRALKIACLLDFSLLLGLDLWAWYADESELAYWMMRDHVENQGDPADGLSTARHVREGILDHLATSWPIR